MTFCFCFILFNMILICIHAITWDRVHCFLSLINNPYKCQFFVVFLSMMSNVLRDMYLKRKAYIGHFLWEILKPCLYSIFRLSNSDYKLYLYVFFRRKFKFTKTKINYIIQRKIYTSFGFCWKNSIKFITLSLKAISRLFLL